MDKQPQTLSLDQIKHRVLTSFVSLLIRSVLLWGISVVTSTVILAKILPVDVVGIFNIANSIVIFFTFFSDIGLAAALVQKKDNVTFEDIKTTFTIQQILVGVISLTVILAAPFLAHFYQLNDQGVWLIRALGLSFFLSSLKVVPSVMLERHLNFRPLVTVEVVETLLYNSLLIILVLMHFSIWSFSIATVGRSLAGTILLYLMAPTKVGFGFNKAAARNLLNFGLPFQANSLLALAKDRLVPLVVAHIIGPLGVGYATWAEGLALAPLGLMSLVIRITFPAFARLQDDKKRLSLAVEKSLFVTALGIYPMLFGIAALLPSLVAYVVQPKWQPAMTSYYLFGFAALFSVVSTTFTNALNAVGKISITLKLMIMWTVLTWLLTPVLTMIYGFIGVGLAAFLISFSSIVAIFITRRILQINLVSALALPLFGSIVMALSVYYFSLMFVRNYLTMGLAVALGVVIYIGIVMLVARRKIMEDIQSLRTTTKDA